MNALRKKWNSLMRKLLLVLLILPLLLLAVSIGFVLLVDPNDYREELEGIGSDLLGRKLVVRGAMKIVPGLVPVLSMADVTVGNPDWAHDPYLAKLEPSRCGSSSRSPSLAASVCSSGSLCVQRT